MTEKTPWLPIPPSETLKDIAAFIIKEYYDFAAEHVNEEKLQTLLYLCLRDAFNITGYPAINETFILDRKGQIRIKQGLPPFKALKNTDPVINNEAIEKVIHKTLPNYAPQENWALRKELRTLYSKVENITGKKLEMLINGTLNPYSLPKHELSLQEIWQDSLEHRPYDYYFDRYFDEDY